MLETLKKYNQLHLMHNNEALSDNQNKQLNDELLNVDFALMNEIYSKRDSIIDSESNDIEALIPTELSDSESKRLFSLGLESIKNNEVSVVLMAGGQGTRLGHDGPKGAYDIGLPSGKSLFEIQCDKLSRLYDLTGVYINWYIMTSEDNHNETVNHFTENNFFGYDKESIIFFKQDRMPLVLENGQIAMKSNYELNLAANGNGGVFSSLSSNKLIDKMKNDGNKWVFLYGVDNVLAKVADPTFVGFTIESNVEVSSKAVDKTYPEEKVGVICYRNSHPDIVEYSELDETLKNEYDGSGKLKYRNGNILSHIFSLDFLCKCIEKKIPYHIAHKKVDVFVNGELIKATEPNGYKYELFMFDVFKFTSKMAVLTVKREEEFAPVKNKEGKDSPEVARKLIYDLHMNWLKSAGVVIADDNESIEIDSRLTYCGENIEGKKLEDLIVG